MAEVTLALDPGNVRSHARFTRGLRWTVRCIMALFVVGAALAEQRHPLIAVVLGAGVAIGILALVEPLLRTDEVLGELSPAGSVVLDDRGVRLHHDSVLAHDGFIPWEVVSAVILDTGRAWGFAYEAGGKRRRLLDNAWSGLDSAYRPPLLSAGPVRPNVLFLLDPPAQLEWAHPDPYALSFVGFRGPGAPARPWAKPASTPAVWVRAVEPLAIKGSAPARDRLRALTAKDVHRLRYELGELPGPNPYRKIGGA